MLLMSSSDAIGLSCICNIGKDHICVIIHTATPVIAPAAPAQTASPNNSSAYATPLVRKIAAERGVELSTVVGTGVGGRIRKEDILTAPATIAPVIVPADRPVESKPHVAPTASAVVANYAPPSELRGRTEPMSRLRKVIAERMVESLQISAQKSEDMASCTAGATACCRWGENAGVGVSAQPGGTAIGGQSKCLCCMCCWCWG